MSKRKSNEQEEEVYTVEKILQKRIRLGKAEYFLKWKNYSDNDNTWEPAENIQNCKELIVEFEESLKRKENAAEKLKKLKETNEIDTSVFRKPNRKDGFARGLSPEKILGATDVYGGIRFLMKWKNCDEADLVPAKEANVKCPQIVIKFYQDNLTFETE
ncbi:hypothetical protein PVAND_011109 [Polypedilum vanderplanki]|uniref:Chromo domain-containing protein n=1 Tax=Polypedilum vanderplanki TaxID=319348 RepID=A0A9J6CIZ6_POLVA|nr:hypothetical protein PVAND_011109 [Polypedilum vanderplanki]